MRTLVATLALVAALAAAGCGGAKLTGAEDARLGDIEYAVDAHAVDGSHYRQVLDGVDYLVDLLRAKPAATYHGDGGHRTVKQVVEDDSNALRDSEPDLAAKLDRVLDDS